MNTFIDDDRTVTIPDGIADLDSFREWLHSGEFPDEGRISYLHGQVWVDMSKEQVFSHNQLKNEIAFALTGLVKRKKLGRYFPDGIRVTNTAAELSCQPDGVFVSRESLDSERVKLGEGAAEGFVELEGSPDLVVEVVSQSSVGKDTDVNFGLYWRAGVKEYWLANARGDRLRFTIYQSGAKGFVPVRKNGGYQRSSVFGESFRLSRLTDERGDPEFSLEIQRLPGKS